MRLRRMIGVHRSANTSAPSAIGQYCPYPSTGPTILRRPPGGSPDSELLSWLGGASIVSAHDDDSPAFWALGDYDRIAAAGRGSRDGGGGRRRNSGPGCGCSTSVPEPGTPRCPRRRPAPTWWPPTSPPSCWRGGAARPGARPDAALAGGGRPGAALRRRGVRRRALVHRRHVRPRPRWRRPASCCGCAPLVERWSWPTGRRAAASDASSACSAATARRPMRARRRRRGAIPDTSTACSPVPTCTPNRGCCGSGSPARPTRSPPTTGGTSRR